MLVRLPKHLLVWIYPRYAGSKGQLCNTGEENGYWINGTTAHLTAIAKALENFLGPCLPKRRWWFLSFLFSLPSYPISISPSLPILYFFHLSLSLPSSLIKQLPLFFSFIYFPVSEQQQWWLLCRLQLHSLSSFSSQLRLSSSTSVLLSWDSHSKEQPQLSPLKPQ